MSTLLDRFVTTTRSCIVVAMAVCIPGNRPSGDVSRSGMDGDYRRNDEWQRMAKHYGGVRDDSEDGGKAAFKALVMGGSSGFSVLFGGAVLPGAASTHGWKRTGFYWTASESDSASAWLYNFGKGSLALYRQREGEKEMAISVRCVRE